MLLCAALTLAAASLPAPAMALSAATLRSKLASAVRAAGSSSGAYVSDLTANRVLYSSRATVGRIPASNEKLYTTAAALSRFGSRGRLYTDILTSGAVDPDGLLSGNIYLRGGGDPTLSTSDINRLAALIKEAGITRIDGGIVADESFLDSRRGGPASGFYFDGNMGGSLSALAVNRGLSRVSSPATASASLLGSRLKKLKVLRGERTRLGKTPKSADRIARVSSPPISQLIELINVPSDNFIAEMLIKDLGARFGSSGSTAAGAKVVRSYLRTVGIAPDVSDGSGLSRGNATSPRQLVTLLAAIHRSSDKSVFEGSLAVAGRSGTLAARMNGTAAEGRCRGKTGTLNNVSALSGLCRAGNGHTIAFSLLMNSFFPADSHKLQDRAAVAIARYGD